MAVVKVDSDAQASLNFRSSTWTHLVPVKSVTAFVMTAPLQCGSDQVCATMLKNTRDVS